MTGENGSSATSSSVKISREMKAVARHRLVRNWTKNVDIFDKDFIVIPINENAHWYLAIICFPGLCASMTPQSSPQKPEKVKIWELFCVECIFKGDNWWYFLNDLYEMGYKFCLYIVNVI